MRRQNWQPLLSGNLGTRASRTAREILEESATSPPEGISLVAGAAGRALTCGLLGQGDEAERFLDLAADGLQEGGVAAGFYFGLAGVGWVSECLIGPVFEEDEEDANEEIDAALLEVLRRGRTTDPGLFHGLVGLGVYAIERLPRPAARECVEHIVAHLERLADPDGDFITWRTRPETLSAEERDAFPNGYASLGMAHGVPGIIGFLGEVCASGVASDRARRLLDGAVPWLLEQRLACAHGPDFPYQVATGAPEDPARQAWCFGAPGIAAALLVAARGAGVPEWEQRAIEIARAAARRPMETSGVNDASLGKGSAGLGHIFNRIYQATGDDELRDAAIHWFERALAERKPGRGVAGYKMFDPHSEGYWVDDAGFLFGVSGVALALHAATTADEPIWDRALLARIAPSA